MCFYAFIRGDLKRGPGSCKISNEPAWEGKCDLPMSAVATWWPAVWNGFAFFRLWCTMSGADAALRGSTCRPPPVAFTSHRLTVGTDVVNGFRQSRALFNLLHASLGRHNGIHITCFVISHHLVALWKPVMLSLLPPPLKAAIVTFPLVLDYYCFLLCLKFPQHIWGACKDDIWAFFWHFVWCCYYLFM